VIIRREVPGEERPISDVHADAFAAMYPDGHPVEPGLVDALRSSDAWIGALSLVAEIDGRSPGTSAARGRRSCPAGSRCSASVR
jgi:putative acetyltransferase